jgi:hypothetical protein
MKVSTLIREAEKNVIEVDKVFWEGLVGKKITAIEWEQDASGEEFLKSISLDNGEKLFPGIVRFLENTFIPVLISDS